MFLSFLEPTQTLFLNSTLSGIGGKRIKRVDINHYNKYTLISLTFYPPQLLKYSLQNKIIKGQMGPYPETVVYLWHISIYMLTSDSMPWAQMCTDSMPWAQGWGCGN